MRKNRKGGRPMSDGLIQRVRRWITLDDWPDPEPALNRSPSDRRASIVRLDFRRDPVIKHYRPRTFDEVELAADLLKSGAPVIITLESAESSDKTRMIDFLLGVAFALDGYVRKIAPGVYMFSPPGIPIEGPEPDKGPESKFELLDVSDTSSGW